jgi:hypothetical protein
MKRVRLGVAIAVGLVVAGIVAGPIVSRPLLTRWVWNQFSAQLERTFDATLTVESFDVSVVPAVTVTGTGLRLNKRDNSDAPPIISIPKFEASTSLTRLWNGNIKSVIVDGATISIPSDMRPSLKKPADDPPARRGAKKPRRLPPFTVDVIETNRATLIIQPTNPVGVPLVFDIELARLVEFSTTEPTRFEARVINPKPRGAVAAIGKLGPWQSDDPRKTHIEGDYTLTKADMSVFKGIGGSLDATGRFNGALDNLAVEGTTSMTDFSVETGKHPMPLSTSFKARVDGTNGNTYLDRVSAKLGNSPIEAVGEIAGKPGIKGKTIRLKVTTQSALLDDLITLVVDQQPTPMRGRLILNARMELPPGDEPVIDTLKLNGQFTIQRGRFSSDMVQDKVDELSRKGQGKPKDTSVDNELSEFNGRFALNNGVLDLPSLQFIVRGAEVRLAGSYGLRGERLDFIGELRLQAKISQTQTGFKSVLLKVIDPFFSKHGVGALLPIRVGGTVASPEFGLNMFGNKKKVAPVNAPSARPSPGKPSRQPES